jgi:outer membrane protein assembly factor BamB
VARRLSGMALLALVGALLAGCGSGGPTVPSAAPPEAHDWKDAWPEPNGDLANTRQASSSISSSNVHDLGIAWAKPIALHGAFGVMSATPVIAGGVVYVQDMASNVTAYSLKTGRHLWQTRFNAPDEGPNGVAVGYGLVYGATSDFAFALSAVNGKEVWRSAKLTRNSNEGIDMAPAVFDGHVYVSTVPGNSKAFYAGNGVGRVFALDAQTGETAWVFDTVPPRIWATTAKNVKTNSGGGLWHPPAFDGRGRMFIDIANPAPWPGTNAQPWGASRPGPNLYTDSLVRLDRRTGKLVWYRQMIPHDIYDWDLQLPPVIAEVDGKEVVVSAGKMGYVYETDATTGQLLWKRAVGVHNGHDFDPWRALSEDTTSLRTPEKVEPGPLGGVETQLAVSGGTIYAPIVDLPVTYQSQSKTKLNIAGGSGELVALDAASGSILWDTKFKTPVYGAATVSHDLVFTTTFDGTVWALDRTNGSVVWKAKLPAGTNAPLAIAGDYLVTAASFPLAAGQQAQVIAYTLGGHGKPAKAVSTTTGSSVGSGESGGNGGSQKPSGPGTKKPTTTTSSGGASLTAGKGVFNANCASCHTLADANAHGSVGPNLDDLKPDKATVARQVRNGGGGMPAFGGRLSDAQIAQVAAYVAAVAGKSSGSSGGGAGGP